MILDIEPLYLHLTLTTTLPVSYTLCDYKNIRTLDHPLYNVELVRACIVAHKCRDYNKDWVAREITHTSHCRYILEFQIFVYSNTEKKKWTRQWV